jgi:hypothetical protein
MRLHALVCAGRIEIVDAQKAIAEDWTQAWLRYVHFVSLSGDPVRLNKDRNAGDLSNGHVSGGGTGP